MDEIIEYTLTAVRELHRYHIDSYKYSNAEELAKAIKENGNLLFRITKKIAEAKLDAVADDVLLDCCIEVLSGVVNMTEEQAIQKFESIGHLGPYRRVGSGWRAYVQDSINIGELGGPEKCEIYKGMVTIW